MSRSSDRHPSEKYLTSIHFDRIPTLSNMISQVKQLNELPENVAIEILEGLRECDRSNRYFLKAKNEEEAPILRQKRDDASDRLTKKLNDLANSESAKATINGKNFGEILYNISLTLTKAIPRNEIDPETHELLDPIGMTPIKKENIFLSSENRTIYDITSIFLTIENSKILPKNIKRNEYFNPLTNQAFKNLGDIKEITAIQDTISAIFNELKEITTVEDLESVIEKNIKMKNIIISFINSSNVGDESIFNKMIGHTSTFKQLFKIMQLFPEKREAVLKMIVRDPSSGDLLLQTLISNTMIENEKHPIEIITKIEEACRSFPEIKEEILKNIWPLIFQKILMNSSTHQEFIESVAQITKKFPEKNKEIANSILPMLLEEIDRSNTPNSALYVELHHAFPSQKEEIFKSRIPRIIGSLAVPSGGCKILSDLCTIFPEEKGRILNDGLEVMMSKMPSDFDGQLKVVSELCKRFPEKRSEILEKSLPKIIDDLHEDQKSEFIKICQDFPDKKELLEKGLLKFYKKTSGNSPPVPPITIKNLRVPLKAVFPIKQNIPSSTGTINSSTENSSSSSNTKGSDKHHR